MLAVYPLNQFLFEGVHIGTQRCNPIGSKGLLDEFSLGTTDMWCREQNLLIDILAINKVDHPAVMINHRQVVDRAFIHQVQSIPARITTSNDLGLNLGQHGKLGIESMACQQQATQITIGQSTLESTILPDEKKDAQPRAIQLSQRIVDRRPP
ncbi:hypothetical protein EDC61_105127 [Sulfuritortus calidifontis]|uniref:Uncharacterized protein n=1 Tax=Sulfuritortus calidifontis TaxID=1914471 RepID=A0A4R3JY50_9PROT|nr:hypothetical protein EDC61_105127 [Sulfuritortus calidifontis]